MMRRSGRSGGMPRTRAPNPSPSTAEAAKPQVSPDAPKMVRPDAPQTVQELDIRMKVPPPPPSSTAHRRLRLRPAPRGGGGGRAVGDLSAAVPGGPLSPRHPLAVAENVATTPAHGVESATNVESATSGDHSGDHSTPPPATVIADLRSALLAIQRQRPMRTALHRVERSQLAGSRRSG